MSFMSVGTTPASGRAKRPRNLLDFSRNTERQSTAPPAIEPAQGWEHGPSRHRRESLKLLKNLFRAIELKRLLDAVCDPVRAD